MSYKVIDFFQKYSIHRGFNPLNIFDESVNDSDLEAIDKLD